MTHNYMKGMYMNDKNFVIKRSEVYQTRRILDITFSLLFCVLSVGCGRQPCSSDDQAFSAYQEACVGVMQGRNSRLSCSIALATLNPFVRTDLRCAGMYAALLFALGDEHAACGAYAEALALAGPIALRLQLQNDYACALASIDRLRAAVPLWRHLLRNPLYGYHHVVWANIAHAFRVRARPHLAACALQQARAAAAKC